jgi:hypothetical protein
VNFIDPTRTRQLELGSCQCTDEQPRPHQKDWATVRTQLGFADYTYILDGGGEGEQARRTLEMCVTDWSLLGPDGKPWPPNRVTIGLLDPDRAIEMAALVDEAIGSEAKRKLPNPSGAPSPDISSENGQSRQTMKELEKSTTSS